MNRHDRKNPGAARYKLVRKDGLYHLTIDNEIVILTTFEAAIKRMKNEEHIRQGRDYIVGLSFATEYDPPATEIIKIKAPTLKDAVSEAQYQVAENQALAIEHGGEIDGEVMVTEAMYHPDLVDRFYFKTAFVWNGQEMVAITDDLLTITLWEKRED
jgi:hypothetical protein|tara:strand:- start:61 stop:531 length:471 start_codon:yes stop_codon:yes gene_type:complete